jgi:erythromycin esterase-like protein
MSVQVKSIAEHVREDAVPLTGAARDYDVLMDQIGDAQWVLLGEASHGTHEFYRERAEITRRLITEKDFNAVAVEADWPDAYRVNRFVQARSDDTEAVDALSGFLRFPTWMWRNADVLDFAGWLREHNDGAERKTGFYGVDLYSLYASIQAVLQFLDLVDPPAAQRARFRYGCFEHFSENTQAYGYAASFGISKSCEDEAVKQLIDLQRHATELAQRDGRIAEDEFFYAEQNARLVKNAEEYYRTMFKDNVSSWNIRDRHMAETLEALMTHLTRHGQHAKIVVWEHNSHLGDARATQMGQRGEFNVGQLVRERHGDASRLIGFTTHTGTVTAASEWDAPAERKRVRPSLKGSYEEIFHESGVPQFVLDLRKRSELIEELRTARLERAIGVIYRPDTERFSHYFHARLPEQFDSLIHFDHTRAVEPLERTAQWRAGEAPETFPFSI